MTAPLFSEEVGGVDDPTDGELAQLGVPSDARCDLVPVSLRQRIHWKARALAAERALHDARRAQGRMAALLIVAGCTLVLGCVAAVIR